MKFMRKQLAIILFVMISAFVTAQNPDERGYIVKTGDQAPDFNITLTTGKRIRLSELKGKIIMLQFTASWCSVCRKEMPFIESDIWQQYKNNKNFRLIAIDRDEPLQTVLKFIESTKITYPVGLDPKAAIFARYAQREAGITRNVIIDKTGKIVMLTRLYNEEEFGKMKEVIRDLLKE